MPNERQRWVPALTFDALNKGLRRTVEVLDIADRVDPVTMTATGTAAFTYPNSLVAIDTASAVVAVTLPAPRTVPGFRVTLVRDGANRATVTDGVTTWPLELDGDALVVISDGAEWRAVSQFRATTGWATVTAASDQAIINSATLTDSALTFPVRASTKYRFRGHAFLDTTAAGDFKFDLNGPASPTLVRFRVTAIAAGAATFAWGPFVEVSFAQSRSAPDTGTDGASVEFAGVLHNGANAGNVTFRFAQDTATNDTGAILRAGSWVEYAPL